MRPERLPTWARVIAGLFAAVTAWGIFLLVRPAISDPVPTALGSGDASGRMLSVIVASCNKNPTGEVVETDETVTVTAYAKPAGVDGADCADAVGFTLDSLLGERAVIDGATGRTVAIRRPGRVQSGDLVSVLVDQALPDGATDTAIAHVEPSTVAEQWATLGAFGPPPVFDPEHTFAVVLTAADSVDCPEDSQILFVDGSVLRLETGLGSSTVPCTPRDEDQVVIALVSTELLGEVTSVSIRGRDVELIAA